MIDEKEHGGVMEIDKELMTKIYDLRRRLHSIPEASMHAAINYIEKIKKIHERHHNQKNITEFI